jgi:hypothetical protein
LFWGVYSGDSVLSRLEHEKPHHLTDSNRLHNSKPCSNHTTVTSHHDGWKTNTVNTPQVKLNIIKMERLAQHSRLHGST